MFCPYCGRAVDSGDPNRYVCQGCGRSIYVHRSDLQTLAGSGDLVGRFDAAAGDVADGYGKRALENAERALEESGGSDPDAYLLRGCVYALMGEDGRAQSDWKKALELLPEDGDLDAYVCILAKAVSRMILLKEQEFVEFNVVSFIDRLGDELDAASGASCKSFLYFTIYMDCVDLVGGLSGAESDEFKDVLPDLFRRVVAYQRNFWVLSQIIKEYLDYIGYEEETFDEDDNVIPHVYYLIRKGLEERLGSLSEEDRLRLFDRWNDKSLKEQVEPLLDAMVVRKSILDKIRVKEGPQFDFEGAVRAYLDKCLQAEAPAEPAEPAPADEPDGQARRAAPFFLSKEPEVLQQYLDADDHEDDAPEDLGLVPEPAPDGAAGLDADRAYEERDDADNERGRPYRGLRHRQGYADGERVYAGGYGQEEHRLEAEAVVDVLLLPRQSFAYHVEADESQQAEGDPVVVGLDEVVDRGAEVEPDDRHQELEEPEPQAHYDDGLERGLLHGQALAYGHG